MDFVFINKSMDIKKCVYCGDDADTKDHIIPITFYHTGNRKDTHTRHRGIRENLVDCCRQCNSIAGNTYFDNIDDKKEYIREKLIKKYKSLINIPYWEEDEILELSHLLQVEVRIKQLARKWILNRINYPIILFDTPTMRNDLREFLEKKL